MMLFKRQKLLLNLVHAAGGELSARDLQKLLFLYTQDCEEEPSFQFVPHRFGCYSFQSAADRDTLQRKGMIYESSENSWKVTPKAKPFLDRKHKGTLEYFLSRTVPERGDALVRRTYRLYPYFATRSEILNRLLRNKNEREVVLEARPPSSGQALFTIGYEGDDIDGYLGRLIRNGVKLLCDVRRNPLSRKTGFSKGQLSNYCSKVGIEYRHLPDLGIPGHRRRELNTMEDYRSLFAEYRSEDLPNARTAINELGSLLRDFNRIALTCFEKEHECCHRHCVADEMKRLLKGCPEPKHI